MSEVGRYRKVFTRIWRHPGFKQLPRAARELTFYLLTGPQANRIGLFNFSVATAAEDLGITAESVRNGLVNVSTVFGWQYDAKARVFYIPSWWRWNEPQNPNIVTGSLKDLSEVAPCALIDAFAKNTEWLPEKLLEPFLKSLTQSIHVHYPTQEQDRELDRDRKLEQAPRAENARSSRAGKKGDALSRLVPQAMDLAGPSADINVKVDALLSLVNKNGNDYRRQDAIDAFIQAGVLL